MSRIATIEDLEAIYGTPGGIELDKVATHLTPVYWRWISRSRFCVLSTVGPEGTDGSPRGDDRPVVTSPDPQTLLLPDWRGNPRKDSLRNIVRDPRVSLMFMIPGSDNVVRVNGSAEIRTDADLLESFAYERVLPRTVLKVTVGEVYFQCARALRRSALWSGADESAGLPTAGEMTAAHKEGFDAVAYDVAWPARADKTMW